MTPYRKWPQADHMNTIEGHEVWYYEFPDGWSAVILTPITRTTLFELHGCASAWVAARVAERRLRAAFGPGN